MVSTFVYKVTTREEAVRNSCLMFVMSQQSSKLLWNIICCILWTRQ